MKYLLLATLLLPCLIQAQVHTKVSFTIPEGFTSDIVLYSSENDGPVWQGQATAGRHTVTVQTKKRATAFIYIAATRQSFSFKLNGKAADITSRIKIPANDDEAAASPEIFPGIDKNFLAVTSTMQNLSAVPQVINDSAQEKYKVQQYYAMLTHLIKFTDSVVTLYPGNNVSLFTVFRLARWCAYSPDVYAMLNKLDTSLLNNDFAKDLADKKETIQKDSMAVAGKKTSGIVQKAVTSTKFNGAAARERLLVYWDDFSRPDRELVDEIKRLHLLFGNDVLQINFIYTGTSENWAAIAKQAGLPAYANYLRCSKPDQTGTSPVITTNDNICLVAGLKGYNLYRKISSDEQQ